MLKLNIVFLVTFIVFVSAQEVRTSEDDKTIAPKIIESIDEFRAQNPDLEIVQLKPIRIPGSTTVRYFVGRRTQGDRFVSHIIENQVFTKPNNFLWETKYPRNELFEKDDYVITFAECYIDVGSESLNAYLISGGVGQRYIKVIFEMKGAQYFNYNAYLYGLPY